MLIDFVENAQKNGVNLNDIHGEDYFNDHLNCARIELKQNTQVNPLIYNGSGIIYQNQLGEFIVEFIHIYKESGYNAIDDYKAHCSLSQPGKEIRQEFFLI